ncbi:hypothetical protein BBP40_002721 [Aspergillus hancockii]|nr:hypothetical protein BBP40_002721 [Aspergillus hancockii]
MNESPSDRLPSTIWRSNRVFLVITVSLGLVCDTFILVMLHPVLPSILEDYLDGQHEKDQWSFPHCCLSILGAPSSSPHLVTAIGGRSVRLSEDPLLGGLGYSDWGKLQTIGRQLFADGEQSTRITFGTSSLTVTVIARCLHSCASGLLWPTGFAVCFEAVESVHIGSTLGLIMMFQGIGATKSPLVGGWLYVRGGRFSLAAIETGFLVFSLLLCAILVEHLGKEYSKVRQDSPLAENTPLLAEGNDDPVVPLHQSRLARMAPILLCFSNASFLTAISLCVLKSVLFGVVNATVPLRADGLFHLDAFERGLLFTPFTRVRLLTAPFVYPESRRQEIACYGLLLALVAMAASMIASAGFVTANVVMWRYHQRNPALFGKRPPGASLNGVYLTAINVGLSLGPIFAGVAG